MQQQNTIVARSVVQISGGDAADGFNSCAHLFTGNGEQPLRMVPRHQPPLEKIDCIE
jgi:hypothetical protein